MGINAVNSNAAPYIPESGAPADNGVEGRIRQLEQKLVQLGEEKEKAEEKKDKDKVRELEKKIQEIQKQIEQLRRREGKTPEDPKAAAENDLAGGARPQDPTLGQYIDERV